MKSISKNHLLLHFIVFIWGWSPILGKLISVEAYALIWYRMGFTLIALLLYFFIIKQSVKLNTKDLFTLFVVGAVIAFHWFCFYHAIKVSNVSITLAAFATGTLFTSLIEPIFYKRKLVWYEIVFGLIIIGAISMIFQVESTFSIGLLFGMLAALTSSLFTVWNGLLVRRIEANLISFFELTGGFIFLSIWMIFTGEYSKDFFLLSTGDFFYLSILSVIGTAFPFIASTNLLKKISPFTLTLSVNMETVYGIILAFIFWKKDEQMTPAFYLGTLIILATIVTNAVLKFRLNKRKSREQLSN